MSYQPHEILLHQARPKAELWRLALGVVLVVVTWFALGLISDMFLLPGVLALTGGADLYSGSDPAGMAILLGNFIFATIAVGLVLQMLHGRSLGALVGPRALLLPQGLQVGRILLLVLVVLLVLPPYDMGAPLVANLAFGQWVALLPLSLVLVLIQVSAEEILFRGYLQQGLAARFKSPLVWLVLPSLLFGMGHYMPQEAGDNAWLIVAGATLYGMLMADLTARSGSLGPAIAVHFVNNVWALLIVSSPSSLNGLALYLHPFAMDDVVALRPWLWVDVMVMLVSWLAARVAIRA
ncbi:CPBP family intramembrane glutamic endopeptidase [Tritonibacter mobilis]|uniref:CPBP family intramembrane glutamic endopeptidase n=1 Tax=Tritonibacter mobilis TaxID=379347 RepID=UPI001401C8E8|nr:CPBP family intramembrane glutamic endopeptidase [Tritonibacter mobilis]NHM17743.1 CPBP family intramembrane metalloprotease [Tritonibacter mobilis]NHM21929.1 CPBP family intramembrane metalloprotease [Tritonibacter mobilis]